MKRTWIGFALAACSAVAAIAQEGVAPPEVKKVDLKGLELSYIERGSGTPIVLVHGELDDYRSWLPLLDAFAVNHRVVAVSRRLSYPNQPTAKAANDYSARVDGDDLAAFIKKLNLDPAHVVGISYGAYGALALAAKNPNMVRSLVLSEPPILPWLNDIEGGKAHHDAFMDKVWRPTVAGFRSSDAAGLRAALDGLGAFGYTVGDQPLSFDGLSAERRVAVGENVAALRALTQSREPFPEISQDVVGRVVAPTLLLAGDRTLPMHKMIDRQLQRLLPIAQRTSVYNATHALWSEYPEVCTKLALEFIAKQ